MQLTIRGEKRYSGNRKNCISSRKHIITQSRNGHGRSCSGQNYCDLCWGRLSLGAAASGALAATGIGLAGAVAANAAIGGATYLANSAIDGDTPNWSGFATSAAIGAVSGLIGGSGLSGAKVTGIKKTAKAVLKTAVSPKKIAMYTAKIAACNKAVTIAIVRTAASVHGGIILNKAKDYAMGVIDE